MMSPLLLISLPADLTSKQKLNIRCTTQNKLLQMECGNSGILVLFRVKS